MSCKFIILAANTLLLLVSSYELNSYLFKCLLSRKSLKYRESSYEQNKVSSLYLVKDEKIFKINIKYASGGKQAL